MDKAERDEESQQLTRQPRNIQKRKLGLGLAVFLVLLGLSAVGYLYTSSPEQVRNPQLEHLHFRMQVVVDGKAENFGDSRYQQEYDKGQCSVDLTDDPIHFHDGKDQIVHIHWRDITGGMVLKNYGWNHIGGIEGAHGYRLDDLKNVRRVNIYGSQLPQPADGTNYFVYVGDEKKFEEKTFDDFINMTLEDFFGTRSSLRSAEQAGASGISSFLFPKASAHGSPESHALEVNESTDEKLTRINNLIGNVVIFAQKIKPSDEEVRARFEKLEPLSESTCGG